LRRLEQDCATQVSALRNGQPAPLSGELRSRKVRLLQSILADDREIRIITEPWMEQLSLLMHGPRPDNATAAADSPARRPWRRA
ncbi:MAG: flagellar protein FliT, partial [Noviherbaspirillum sp.]